MKKLSKRWVQLRASRPGLLRASSAILLLLLTVPAPAQTISPAEAERELSTLDFFEGGQGMHLSPGILDKLESLRGAIKGSWADDGVLKALARRWGLEANQKELVGVRSVSYQKLSVGVVGCVACHSGRAAGRYIIGIGNKNIDPGQMGRDGVPLEMAYQKITDELDATGLRKKSAEFKEVEESSLSLMKKLRDPRLSAQTQGLVPVALVGSWFYEMAGKPLPTNGYLGAVKVPSWFGFGKKLELGQFADAIGQGHPPGWIIGVEITAGQTAQGVRDYFSKVEHASDLISALLPPKYPFFIDTERAARGKLIFEQSCAHCHGTYEFDGSGNPIYQTPKAIPWESVRTDSDRLDYVTEDFLNQVRASPLADLIKLSSYAGKRRYVAPRLHAIWARFPYLHNGSVPTLRDLLEPASKRTKVFSLKDAGEKTRFDEHRMGLSKPRNFFELDSFVHDVNEKRRWIYDTRKFGQSNIGHEKMTDLPDASKDDIVEYLKTL